jgi:hypothetical protein
MGYTHYFYRHVTKSSDADLYEVFASQAHRILRKAEKWGIQLADKYGDNLGKWEIDSERISFNGYGPESHETFSWPRQAPERMDFMTSQPEDFAFDFCKTSRKPYDAVVTALLILANDIYGDAVRISSDGDWQDWEKGAELYERALGAVARVPFEKEMA